MRHVHFFPLWEAVRGWICSYKDCEKLVLSCLFLLIPEIVLSGQSSPPSWRVAVVVMLVCVHPRAKLAA